MTTLKRTLVFTFLSIASLASFASEECSFKDRKGFHPNGVPFFRVQVDCSNGLIQKEIILRFSEKQIGNSNLFLAEVKPNIIEFIKTVGYSKIKTNLYQKE